MAQSPNKISAAESAVAAHYGLLLGIQSPWHVQRADLDLAAQQVQISVEHASEGAGQVPAMPAGLRPA